MNVLIRDLAPPGLNEWQLCLFVVFVTTLARLDQAKRAGNDAEKDKWLRMKTIIIECWPDDVKTFAPQPLKRGR